MQKIAELISEDITERILEKLNEIEKSSNLSNLDVSTILNKLPAVTSKGFVTDQNELWKDVSKLSVDFYLDFEYYKQFTFQSKFSCAEYHDALKNLGFKEINGFWKSYCKPSKTLVINYVVQSCIYRTIMMKMNGIDSVDEVMTINNTSELIGSCPFCDKNLNSVHNCEACGATAEEIENLRNQAKLIENKHNPSVGGGIEVVENDLLCTEHVDSVNITGNSLINSDNNNNDNTNENSKSIPNINFSEEIINKQKINRGTQCGIDREKDGRTESCICCDGKCEERNDGNELYCTYCGLCLDNSCKEKFCNNSCSEELRVTNESDSNNLHGDALSDDHNHVGEQKSSIKNECKDKSCNISCSEKSKVTNELESKNSQNEEPTGNKWKCKRCGFVNEDGKEFCVVCMVNCGEENVNKTIKYCSKCKQKEIIFDDLCEDCLKARDEIWTCWYRLCENRNAGNVKYCQHCGLDRYAYKIKFGAPMWCCKDDVPDQIWICDKCFNINDISYYPNQCQNYLQDYPKHSCFGRNKYTKRCYKCEYKYNYEYSNYCEMCKDKLSWI